jgi:hypothetical protein
VNCDVLDVVGVANVIVAFVITDVGDKDATAVVDGTTVEVPDEPVGGALVVDTPPAEELDPAEVGRAVPVSDTRVPVRLYAAAQAARDIPCIS